MKETFAKRLSRLRKAKGKTIAMIADEISMRPSTYKDMEGGSLPRNFLTVLEKTAHSLGVSPTYLLMGEQAGKVSTIIKDAEQIKKIADQIIQSAD